MDPFQLLKSKGKIKFNIAGCIGIVSQFIVVMILFFPMIPLAWFAFRPKWDITKVIILWSGVIFGVLTEWIQHYLPHRTGDITDVAADIVGSVLGIPLLLFFSLFKRK